MKFREQLLSVLLKALPPVCMKYTAQGESQVANVARDHHQELYILYKRSLHFIQTKLVFYTY